MATLHLSRPGIRAGHVPVLRVALASLLTAAGTIHGLLTPDHLAESAALGLGFAGAALFQIGIAALVLARPSRLVYVAVVAGSVGLIGLYVSSVTVGVPLHSAAGHHGEAAAAEHSDAGDGPHHGDSYGEPGHHEESGSEVEHHGDSSGDVAHAHATPAAPDSGSPREPIDAVGVLTQVTQLAAIAIGLGLLWRSAATRPSASRA